MNCFCIIHSRSTSHSESTSISESHTNKSIKLHNKLLSNSKYIITKHIAKTLQGEVCIAEYAKYKQLVYGYVHQIANNLLLETGIPVHIFDICYLYFHEQVVIKRAEKLLHFLGITITEDGTRYKVKENIIQEAQLMEMFMQYNPPNTLIQFRDFYQDTNNFYLVMEKGGMGLLQFTIKCHKLIVDGKLSLHEWRKSVRNIFVKMVTFINWMHNVVHCCNLDISLENIVISNDTYFDENASKIRNLNIKFIDFGLTEMFNAENNFICDKWVGKTAYQSPQLYQKHLFMADKNDIWALGICLYMLSIGSSPFSKADISDIWYKCFVKGQMKQMLQQWNRLHYVERRQYDLMMRMICIDEKKRLCIEEIMNHVWIKSYFVDDV